MAPAPAPIPIPTRLLLPLLLLAAPGAAARGLRFVESPGNRTASPGQDVALRCTVQAPDEPPDITWHHNGHPLELADSNQLHLPLHEDDWLGTSELSILAVQLSDMGWYQCALWVDGEQMLSDEAHLTLEGLPVFSEEPQDQTVAAETPLNLSCGAQGPPEPVRLVWLQDGAPLNGLHEALARVPSTLTLAGLTRSAEFSCEAHNAKGVTTSRTAVVTVVPQQPQNLALVTQSTTALELAWEPGASGDEPLTHCTVQVLRSDEELPPAPPNTPRALSISVPPFGLVLGDLEPFASYHVRAACRSRAGASRWTHWLPARTLEAPPSAPPDDVMATRNGTRALVQWREPPGRLPGVLHGYRLAYRSAGLPEVVVDVGLAREAALELAPAVQNLTVRVAARTGAGEGPWSFPLPVPGPDHDGQPEPQTVRDVAAPALAWPWWAVVVAVAAAGAFSIILVLFLARVRRKETRYGEAFEPRLERGELVVHYRVRKSYSRRTTEATLNRLGISEELKEKLRDVMVDRHRVALGKTLGEGEFGAVVEGQLHRDGAVLKVAVKTMKIAICTRSELEDFLSEAVCMKDFDHPNVMTLIGVCLQSSESGGFPAPVVLLPFMQHGDLHSFLLYSRLGDTPTYLPMQTLLKFMADIASGMAYLSSKNFIHRDLAARNCMLDESMRVRVADFGLSKKIYSGDYYRQGRIAKMPVKWIAIESLADRVYTTKSDVWSFGVTMWEIATRGQTPYPGVENSEIYDYLRQGHRLRQPPDCLDGLYELMSSCWTLSPRDRPGFEELHEALAKILGGLPPPMDPAETLYVNMEEGGAGERAELGAVGGWGPEEPGCPKGGCVGAAGAQVPPPRGAGRYVLCPPPHEGSRALGDPPGTSSPCTASEEGA